MKKEYIYYVMKMNNKYINILYMDNLIYDSEKHDLSGADIMRITDNKTNIMTYEQLENVNNINDIFIDDACVILYQTKEFYGHWVALLRRSNNTLEFYDPYGFAPDEDLQYSDYNLREHNGELVPHLTVLMKGYKVIYNKEQLQEVKEHVNTCGRYCALRIRLKDASLNKFNNLLTYNKCYNADFWVSALTILI